MPFGSLHTASHQKRELSTALRSLLGGKLTPIEAGVLKLKSEPVAFTPYPKKQEKEITDGSLAPTFPESFFAAPPYADGDTAVPSFSEFILTGTKWLPSGLRLSPP